MPVGSVYLSLATDVVGLVTGSGPVAKAIILLLLILSLASWAVMVERWRRLRRAETLALEFRESFEKVRAGEKGLDSLAAWCQEEKGSVEGSLLLAFHTEWWPLAGSMGDGPRDASQIAALEGLLARALRRATDRSLEDLQQGLGWLATLSSVAPFLGLLGTVWGIMGSFLELGRQGSAALEVVGPGIAEALVTTAAGLAVAIPAVVGYNHFMGRLRRREVAAEELASELMDLPAAQRLRSNALQGN